MVSTTQASQEKYVSDLTALQNLRENLFNQELISGSGLSNQVVGVLTCFQQKPVTFMADVEFMHYQVMVPYNQFLWWNHQP